MSHDVSVGPPPVLDPSRPPDPRASRGGPDALEARVARLEDEAAVLRALHRYAHAIDYGDEAGWVDCFTDDGVFDIRSAQPGAPTRRIAGHSELQAFIARHTRAPERWHKHLLHEPIIDVEGATATCRSYFAAVVDHEARPVLRVFGRYLDRLVRGDDGRWRFVERVAEIESLDRSVPSFSDGRAGLGGEPAAQPTGDAQRAGDEQAVRDVLLRYASSLDTSDWERFRTCFVPDAVATYTDGVAHRGYEAIERKCRTALGDFDASRHVVANLEVTIEGDAASARSYVQAEHIRYLPGADSVYVVAGTYVDRLVRTARGWRLQTRRLEATWRAGDEGERTPS